MLVHLPFHASWLNQIELVFSVIQRKVLTPNHFTSLQQIVDRLGISTADAALIFGGNFDRLFP